MNLCDWPMSRLCPLLVAGVLALGACSSGEDKAAPSTEAASPSSLATATTEGAPATPSPPVSSPPAQVSLRDCLSSEGTLELVQEVSGVFGETVDTIDEASSGGTVDAFINDMQTYAKEYDRLGRAFKASSDCDDPKWAMMTQDLGDALIETGDRMAVLTAQSINSESSEVLQLVQSVSAVGNQFEVMTDYINKTQ